MLAAIVRPSVTEQQADNRNRNHQTMTGNNILQSVIGQEIKEGIIQSFYYDEQLSDKLNVVYLKFDKWIHITTSDEQTIIKEEQPEQIEPFTIDDNKTFVYQLTKIENEFSDFTNYIGQKLIDFKELVYINYPDQSCGIKLYFANDLTLILFVDINAHSRFSFNNLTRDDIYEKQTTADNKNCG